MDGQRSEVKIKTVIKRRKDFFNILKYFFYCRIPLPLPKRTILNNWNVRNDSSNIGAILHPDDSLPTPRTNINNEKKATENYTKATKTCCLSTNSCYCREHTVKPKILDRPKSCVILEEFKKRLPISNFSRKPIKTCLCSGNLSRKVEMICRSFYRKEVSTLSSLNLEK